MARSSHTAIRLPIELSRLSPTWLSWLAVVAAAGVAWTAGAVANYDALANPPAQAEPALREAMVSAEAHAAYHVVLDLVFWAGAIVVGGLILRRSRASRLAVSAALVLAVWGPLNGLAAESIVEGPAWVRLGAVAAWGGWAWLLVSSIKTGRGRIALGERQRIRWLWYGAATTAALTAAVVAGIGSGATLAEDQIDRHMTGHLLLVFAGSALPIAVFIAWGRESVPDPDTLIRRTIVYAILTAIVAGMTTLFVFLPAVFYYEFGPVYLLTVVCIWAVLGQSVQQWVQRMVNRMMYGQRDEPMVVLTTLGERLALGSPETVLNTIAETVASALKLPAVTIRFAGGSAHLAAIGESELDPVVVPIVHQGEVVGELAVSPRARDEALHEHDHEILRLVAHQAGPTVRAVQLNQELRRSRQEILVSREEERRRIHRDLHDGLGPALAAIAMQADTARAVVDDDPAAARDLLAAVTKQAEDVVHDVRRLVYELRPAALDQLGLVGAVESLARRDSSGTLRIDVVGPPSLPELDAAVEVAVFRIVSESLTNVVRHAQASHCRVSFEAREGVLRVTIDDNGVGISDDARTGVGLRSMQDRASEVGGTISMSKPTGGGTRIVLTMPDRTSPPSPSAGSGPEVCRD